VEQAPWFEKIIVRAKVSDNMRKRTSIARNGLPDKMSDAIQERNNVLERALRGADSIDTGEYGIKIEIFHETNEPIVWSTGWHVHENRHELSLMRCGSMEYKFKDMTVTIDAKKGDMALIPAGTRHCRISMDTASIICGFQVSIADAGTSKRFGKALESIGFHSEGSEGISRILEDLKNELSYELPLRELRLSLLIRDLLTLMLRKAIPSAFKPERNRSSIQDGQGKLALRMLAHLEENISKDISIKDLGDTFDISSRHANRIFAKSFGEPLKRRMTRLRMNAAESELTGSRRQIKDIADSLGYQDCSHFIRVFKGIHGMTPQKFRNSHGFQD
jgi:AraC-like DNA-binding protein/mannose-6-phosphate isomerase-like protein (cupin superfamily)